MKVNYLSMQSSSQALAYMSYCNSCVLHCCCECRCELVWQGYCWALLGRVPSMGGKGGSCCSMNPPTTLTSKNALFGNYGHYSVCAIIGVHLYAVLHGGSWAIALQQPVKVQLKCHTVKPSCHTITTSSLNLQLQLSVPCWFEPCGLKHADCAMTCLLCCLLTVRQLPGNLLRRLSHSVA